MEAWNRGKPRLPIVLGVIAAIGLADPPSAGGQDRPDPAEARAALDSPDATERALAACHLGRMSSADVRPARERLLELLSDGTPVEGELCRDYGHWWDGH